MTTRCHADGCHKPLSPDSPQFECAECHLMHCDEHKVTLSGDEFCPVCIRGIIDDMASELGDQEIAGQERAQFAAVLLAAGVTTEEAAAIDR